MKPQDFVFGIGHDDVMASLSTYPDNAVIVLCPVDNPDFDGEIDDGVGNILPRDILNRELISDQECTYFVTGKSVVQVKQEMLDLGFIHEPDMDW